MLQELAVKNFALIEELQISFDSGLHVMTGETGAGKSMLVDAITVVIGGRASQDLIRHGSDRAYVEALFVIPESMNSMLLERGIDIDEDQSLVVYREIRDQGKSICRINGKLFPVQVLREIMEPLVDIHGQHEHQKLLNAREHLNMLDGYGREELGQLLATVKASYKDYQELKKKHQSLMTSQEEDMQRIDYLDFQVKELNQANLNLDEEADLESRVKRLQNIEKYQKNLLASQGHLTGGDLDSDGAYGLVSKAIDNLKELASLDDKYQAYIDQLNTVNISLMDIARELGREQADDDVGEDNINDMESRLYQIQQVKRKYRMDVDELIAYHKAIKEELYQLTNKDNVLSEIEKKLEASKANYMKEAEVLSAHRQKIALDLEGRIEGELAQLSLPNIKFKIDFRRLTEGQARGIDDVEFLFSANVGEPLKALTKVASGGELSRMMLALKKIFAELDQTQTVIFDEIDTGISGIAAQRVAEKLSDISSNRQVLCITHLSQIAAMSDVHLYIHKEVGPDSTATYIEKLDEEESINELARMISGDIITEGTKASAREIREAARIYKMK